MNNTQRDELARKRLADAIVEKSWSVPAYEGHGPVSMSMRLPEVRITDSEGRFIVISPRQADLVGNRLVDISEWLSHGDETWESLAPEDD